MDLSATSDQRLRADHKWTLYLVLKLSAPVLLSIVRGYRVLSLGMDHTRVHCVTVLLLSLCSCRLQTPSWNGKDGCPTP